MPPGTLVVVIDGDVQLVQIPAAITRPNNLATLRPAESVTLMVTLYDPLVEGVPEIVPVVVPIPSPVGNRPEPMDQVYGEVPPVAANVEL